MGDLAPFLAIGTALKERGHEPILLSNSCYKKLADVAGLAFHSIDTSEEAVRFLQDDALWNSPRELPALFRTHFLPRVLPEYETIVGKCQEKKNCHYRACDAGYRLPDGCGENRCSGHTSFHGPHYGRWHVHFDRTVQRGLGRGDQSHPAASFVAPGG